MPSNELTVKINKIINNNKNSLKEFRDKKGKINLNLLTGSVLGAICSFSDKPMINNVLSMFMPAFNDKQMDDYANFIMDINNYLVCILESDCNNIYLFESNKWMSITDANFDSVYALWYAFFGIMKVEFKDKKNEIDSLRHSPVVTESLESFTDMSDVMGAHLVDVNALKNMQNKFPEYAFKFNELRKLMFMKTIKSKSGLH